MKRCTVCLSLVDLDCFPVDRWKKDGRGSRCFDCNRRYARSYRERHDRREGMRAYYASRRLPCVYCLTVNGMKYFGSCSNPEHRYRAHLGDINRGCHGNPCIRSIGTVDSVEFEILMTFDRIDEARKAERMLIKKNDCCNIHGKI